MQALYLLALEPVAETQADYNSYGFSTQALVRRCHWPMLHGTSREALGHSGFSRVILERALTKSVTRGWSTKWRWTRPCFANGWQPVTWKKGVCIPRNQVRLKAGLRHRPWRTWRSTVWSRSPSGRPHKNQKIHVVKYADDFVITGASREVLEMKVKPAIEAFLGERGLELSTEKTSITHIGRWI